LASDISSSKERGFCRKACRSYSTELIKRQKTSAAGGKNFLGCEELLQEEEARKKEKEHKDGGSVDSYGCMEELLQQSGAIAGESSYYMYRREYQ
jgi:hypothetical protein